MVVRERCKLGRSDAVPLALALHPSTRENGRDRVDTVGGLAPILLVAACAFSVNQTERSYRKKLSNIKRDVQRFTVNVCHRFRCHPMILSICHLS
jgi:hypothetical protein